MFVANAHVVQRKDSVASHGSLAVFVPSASGLVVCADKREWNRIRGASDTETKIYNINPKAAFTITGAVAILDPTTLQPVFSVKDLVIRCLKDGTKQRFVEKLHALPKRLSDSYAAFRKAGGAVLEPVPDRTDDVTYSVTVWYTSGNRVNVTQVQLHDGSGEVSYRDVTDQFSRTVNIDGQTEFVLAAIRNSDPRFATFKEDPEIRTVWTSRDPTTVSPDLAARFGRKVIRATNEFHHLVSVSNPTMVSAGSDCSLMAPSRGFEWPK
jgi:hypothetical protein